MRTFAGFSHYAGSPPWRRPFRRPSRGPPADGAEPGRSLRRCRGSPSVPHAAKMRYPLEALRRDCCGTVGPGSSQDRRRAIGSAGERLVHTEEVTGSIPVSPTGRCKARSGSKAPAPGTPSRWPLAARRWPSTCPVTDALTGDATGATSPAVSRRPSRRLSGRSRRAYSSSPAAASAAAPRSRCACVSRGCCCGWRSSARCPVRH